MARHRKFSSAFKARANLRNDRFIPDKQLAGIVYGSSQSRGDMRVSECIARISPPWPVLKEVAQKGEPCTGLLWLTPPAFPFRFIAVPARSSHLLQFHLDPLVPLERLTQWEALKEPVYVLDSEGRVLWLNAAASSFWQVPRAVFLERSMWEWISPAQRGVVEEAWQRLFQEGLPAAWEIALGSQGERGQARWLATVGPSWGVIRQITSSAEEEFQRDLSQALRMLAEFGYHLHDPQALMSNGLRLLMQIWKADVGIAYQVQGRRLDLVVGFGLDEEFLARFSHLEIDEPTYVAFLAQPYASYIEDARSAILTPIMREMIEQAGVCTLVVLPSVYRGTLVGLLAFGHRWSRPTFSMERDVLTLIGNYIALALAAATGSELAHGELMEYRQAISQVSEASREVTHAVDPTGAAEWLEKAMRIILKLTRAEMGVLLLTGEAHSSLPPAIIVSSEAEPKDKDQQWSDLAAKDLESLIGLEGIRDVPWERLPRPFKDLLPSSPFAFADVIPLRFADCPQGLVVLGRRQSIAETMEAEIRLAEALIGLMASTVYVFRLLEYSQRMAQELAAFRAMIRLSERIPEVHQLAEEALGWLLKNLGFEGGWLLLPDGEGKGWHVGGRDPEATRSLIAELSPEMLSKALEEDQVLVCQPPDAGWPGGARAIVLAPIRAQDRAIGLLGLVSSHLDRLTPAEQAFITMITDQLGVILETARMTQRERRRSQLMADSAER